MSALLLLLSTILGFYTEDTNNTPSSVQTTQKASRFCQMYQIPPWMRTTREGNRLLSLDLKWSKHKQVFRSKRQENGEVGAQRKIQGTEGATFGKGHGTEGCLQLDNEFGESRKSCAMWSRCYKSNEPTRYWSFEYQYRWASPMIGNLLEIWKQTLRYYITS